MDNDLKFYHYFRHTFRINVSYTIEVNLYTRMYTSVLLNKYISCIVYVNFFLFLFWEIRKIHQLFFWNILPILIISFFPGKILLILVNFLFRKVPNSKVRNGVLSDRCFTLAIDHARSSFAISDLVIRATTNDRSESRVRAIRYESADAVVDSHGAGRWPALPIDPQFPCHLLCNLRNGIPGAFARIYFARASRGAVASVPSQ